MAYSPGDTLVRVLFTNETGLVEDQCINDFAFSVGGSQVTLSNAEVLRDYLINFYRLEVPSSGEAVGDHISTSIDRAATHSMQVFRIQASGLGSPLFEFDWLGPTTPLGTQNLPNEVAGVLSFHADLTGVQEELGSTRPKARRRGRVYIGPLRNSAIDGSVPNPPLESNFRLTLQGAAARLKDATSLTFPWCVWSRADQQLRTVVGGWTDDAPDTQRRRGQGSTNRATWS